MKLQNCSLLLSSLILTSCFWNQPKVSSVSTDEVQPSVEIRKEDPLQKKWISLAKVLTQAQAVEREAWWVLTDQKSKSAASSFARLLRAFEKQVIGLKKNKILSCEQFELRKDILDPDKTLMSGQLFETCTKPAHFILDFEHRSSFSLKLVINPEHQADVYGLGVAILGKKIICELTWNDQDILQSLKCQNYERNRSPQEIVELDRFEYSSSGQQLLTLKGRITDSLIPTRKIEAQVPLMGKIVVTEIEIEKPQAQSEDLRLKKPPETRGPRDTVSGANSSAAGPDLIQRKADPQLQNFNPGVAVDSVRDQSGVEKNSNLQAIPPPIQTDASESESEVDPESNIGTAKVKTMAKPIPPGPIKQAEPEMIEDKDDVQSQPPASPSDKPTGR